jgi:hypothetical protein
MDHDLQSILQRVRALEKRVTNLPVRIAPPRPPAGGVDVAIGEPATRPGSYAVTEVSPVALDSTGSSAFASTDLYAPRTQSGVGFNQAENASFGTGVGWIMPVGSVVPAIYVGLDDNGIRIYQFWAIAPIDCGDVT